MSFRLHRQYANVYLDFSLTALIVSAKVAFKVCVFFVQSSTRQSMTLFTQDPHFSRTRCGILFIAIQTAWIVVVSGIKGRFAALLIVC